MDDHTTDAAEPRPPALRAQGLRVSLGGSAIVDDAAFAVHGGEVVVLSGANGAGKSTLLRALVGLLPHDGEARIEGARPSDLDARARFVFVPDDPTLYEDLTLREHARFTTMLYARPRDEDEVLAWLATFRLGERLDEFPRTHSRGMRQKLSLALALGLATPLLILDEPYNGLDLEAQDALSGGLVARAAAGGAVLLTGHQPALAASLGARELHLEDGRVVAASPHPAATTEPGTAGP